MIDPAMLRPGRLDKLLFVDLPSPEVHYYFKYIEIYSKQYYNEV
jgi:SpoVK/Ycf46/Vps4 family AAA+-type ATPase